MACGAEVLPPSPGVDVSFLFNGGGDHFEPSYETKSDLGGALVKYSIVQFNNRGKGFQVNEFIKCGQTIIREKALVMGPKQCSPLVCVECSRTFSDQNENDLTHCQECCLPMCTSCFNENVRPNHQPECDIFKAANVKALSNSESLISKKNDAIKIFSLLTPLRLLLLAENDPSIFDLEANLSSRADTMVFCYNQVNVVKYLHEKLYLDGRFTVDQIQRACGILDTNCYELGWKGTRARALFRIIARMNHNCIPNARKYFDSERRMNVVAARDIRPGEEITLSYTPPLTSTPIRQLILQQTKCFQCQCQRCKDPSENGSNLSALRCHQCNNGAVLPKEPLNPSTEYVCTNCEGKVESNRCKMMLETAMRFVSLESESSNETEHIMSIIKNLERFVSPSHQLITNLKLKLLNEICSLESTSEDVLLQGYSACNDLLKLCQAVAPGKSRLNGIICKQYHQIVDKINKSGIQVNELTNVEVLNQDEINQMFEDDISQELQ